MSHVSKNLYPSDALVESLIWQESRNNDNATNSTSTATGAAQILDATGRQPGFHVTPIVGDGFDNRRNGRKSRQFVREYIAGMRDQYGWDVNDAVTAYNAGPGAVRKWIRDGKSKPISFYSPGAHVPYSREVMERAGLVPGAVSTLPGPNTMTLEAAKAADADGLAERTKNIEELSGGKEDFFTLDQLLSDEELKNAVESQKTLRELQGAPVTRELLTQPAILNLSYDSIPDLISMETAWNTFTSIGEGFVVTPGMVLSGSGHLFEMGTRRVHKPLRDLLIANGLDDFVIALESEYIPAMISAGEDVKEFAGTIGPDPEDENIITRTGMAFGQLIAFGTTMLISGGAGLVISLGTMFSVGVDMQAEAIKASKQTGEFKGIKLDEDLAKIAGGAVTAVTERLGLGLLFNRIPKLQAAKWFKVILGGGTQFTQEILEGIAHDFISLGFYNPDQEIEVASAIEEGKPAGLAAAIMSAILPGRSRVVAPARAKAILDEINKTAQESKVSERDPEVVKEHVSRVVKQAGLESVFINQEKLVEWANKQEGGYLVALNSLGLNDTVEPNEQGDIEIDGDSFAREILSGESWSILGDHVKITPFELSHAEMVEALIDKRAEMIDELKNEVLVTEGLKKRTEKVIKKMLTPEDVMKELTEADNAVGHVIDLMALKVQRRIDETEALVIEGRILELDDQISQVEKDIDSIQSEIEARDKINQDLAPSKQKPTKALETRLERLSNELTTLAREQGRLKFPAKKAALHPKFEQQPEVEGEAKIKVKAKKVRGLGLKRTAESLRSLRQGFEAGRRAAKKDVKTAQKILNRLIRENVPAALRGKFLAEVSKIQSSEQLLKRLPIIQARIIKEVEKARRKELEGVLKKTLKATKVKTDKSGKPAGKYGADAQEVLDQARDVQKLTRKEAKEKLEKMLDNPTPGWAGILEAQLLAIRAGESVSNNEIERLIKALDGFITGSGLVRSNFLLSRKIAVREAVDDLRTATAQGKPGKRGGTRSLAQRLTKAHKIAGDTFGGIWRGWDELIDIAFNKKGMNVEHLIPKLRMTRETQSVKWRAQKWQDEYTAVGMTVYELQTQRQFINKGYELAANNNLGEFINERGETITLEYTKDEAIKFYMEWLDPTLQETILDESGNAYTLDMVSAITNILDPQDRAFAQAQLELYKKWYPEVNKVYSRIYGVNLPFNEFYSPIQRERGVAPLDETGEMVGADKIIFEEAGFRRSVIKSSLKERKKHISPLRKRTATGSMMRYMHDMAHFVETAEKSLFLAEVFGTPQLKGDIENMHSPAMYQQMQAFIADFTVGYFGRGGVSERWISGINRRYAQSAIALKGTIALKQLTSYFAMGEGIPPVAFTKWGADFFTHPKEVVKFLYENSPAMKARGSSLEFELARIGSADRVFPSIKTKWRKAPSAQQVRDAMFLLARYGDRAPIYVGGWARYKYHRSIGQSHQEAMADFESHVQDTQQSTDIDKLPHFARQNAFTRSMFMFMTARTSLLRGEMRALRQWKRGKIDNATFARRFAMYHFVMPSLVQAVASGFNFEDDRWINALLLGQLNNFIVIGDLASEAITWAIGADRFRFSQNVPLLRVIEDIYNAAISFAEDDLMEGILEVSEVIGELTGLPLALGERVIIGGAEIVDGDAGIGVPLVVGYPMSVANPNKGKRKDPF